VGAGVGAGVGRGVGLGVGLAVRVAAALTLLESGLSCRRLQVNPIVAVRATIDRTRSQRSLTLLAAELNHAPSPPSGERRRAQSETRRMRERGNIA
jgi:hypothetical protein